MKLEDIKIILENRLKNLKETREAAVNSGSIIQILNIDDDIFSTTVSLQQIDSIIGE